MSKAQDLQIAIQTVIEKHVTENFLSDADVIGALRVCLACEEIGMSVRLMASLKKDVP